MTHKAEGVIHQSKTYQTSNTNTRYLSNKNYRKYTGIPKTSKIRLKQKKTTKNKETLGTGQSRNNRI